jgi:hypothetical protein
MDSEKALKRIWRTWKYAFIFAIILYLLVFYWALNYEGHRKGEGESLEEPLDLFDVSIYPAISAGANSYTMNITNNQKYIIQELTIEFSGSNFKRFEDFSQIENGEVGGGSSVSYSYLVYTGARAVDIILDDTEVVSGFTDINLYVQNENSGLGEESLDQGNHEKIHLTQEDIKNMGYGTYIVTVTQDSSWRSVSFQLTFSITYSQLVLQQNSNEPITPDQTRDFVFAFDLDEEQISNLRCKVDANVKLSDELSLNIDMTFNSEWELIEESSPIPEEFVDTKPWGPVDLTGTSSAILYSTTVILGILIYVDAKIKKMFIPRYIRRGHCFISLVTLMFVLAHMYTALQKDWPWGSPGMRFAQTATIGLLCFTIFGLFDVEIIKAYGRKKWQLIHIIITLILGALLVLHFGLMGDHLGWLK